MLTRGQACVNQGEQRYEEQQRQRSIDALKRRTAALGFAVTPMHRAGMKRPSVRFVSDEKCRDIVGNSKTDLPPPECRLLLSVLWRQPGRHRHADSA